MTVPPGSRRALGAILIGLGLLVWAPFIYLVASGQMVSIFPFLAAHLAGVLGGEWLRSSANRLEGTGQAQMTHGRRRRIAGTVMIYLGVLAWAPYLYLDKVAGQQVPIGPFLAVHLTGVLGGAAVRASVQLARFLPRE